MSPTARPAKIFIVDDDEAVRDSIKVPLEVHGFEVEDFASTHEFISRHAKPSSGCLILDQHMPHSTGLEFLASSEGRDLGIPVILITAQTDPGTERRALAAGAEYMTKPIRQSRLVKTVERLLERC